MHPLRLLAIVLALCSFPALLGWCLLTIAGGAVVLGGAAASALAFASPQAIFAGVVVMGWLSLGSLGWTAWHISDLLIATPRWVLAGYVCGALFLAFALFRVPLSLTDLRIAGNWLRYFGGPAGLLMLALWRLWQIRRADTVSLYDLHERNGFESVADGTLELPSDHLASPCSSDPPASSR
ncbi:hypothetical protein F2P45_10180 [Massilia sp. CCM 8733]|uniref:Uncharacterized protein n=1 Tax=Massilia mucilaginosa TaxID=2609282 RepID=A0ABX0NR79_9BURK|nr:hypothetical protein [Massilia mucilaginosa]NHZ89379.1 hypothetical protein [Massilia mucilaginosa]